jgi:exodeoxyribonuclease VIII
MIDLETMGTRPDSAMVQVAAVAFQPRSGGRVWEAEAFNQYVDLDSCLAIGMLVERDTVAWWLGQSDDARLRLADGMHDDPTPLATVLSCLADWPKERMKVGWESVDGVWAKPTSFDLPILKTAYRRLGANVPWHYRSERDMRTALMLLGEGPPVSTGGVAHDALDDCVRQIAQLQSSLGFAGETL